MKNSSPDPNKQHIRQQIKTQRRLLDKKIQSCASNEVISRLSNMPLYKKCRSVAVYFAVNGELDPKTLLNQSASCNKTFYLPIVNDNNSLQFAPFSHDSALQKNKFGIPEPTHTQAQLISITALDLICIPLLAFDENRNRLGMGAGYYDRTLADRRPESKPYCIGLAYEFQKKPALVPENWDIPMDCIITDQTIYSSPFIDHENTL